MPKKHLVTRRQLIYAGAALSSGVLLNGCVAATPLTTSLFVQNSILIPGSVGLGVNLLTEKLVDPTLAYFSKVRQSAEENNANIYMCKATDQLMGPDFLYACLKNKISVWPSYNENVQQTSYFDLQITSHSEDRNENGGQIIFGIQDVETGNFDLPELWSDPFEILPHGTQTMRYGPYMRTKINWGRKRIVVRSAPPHVTVDKTDFIVLPLSVRV